MRIRSLSALALVATLFLAACGGSSPTPPPTPAPTPVATVAPTSGAAESANPSVEPPASGPIASVPAGSSGVSGVSSECQAANLATKTPGTLTISTDNPAYPPWFGGTPPSGSEWGSEGGYPPSGQGFESAIAYAVAAELGFTEDQVTWIPNASFDATFNPGTKDYDFHLAQDSYSKKRAKAVDFSNSYYDVAQALVATSGSPIASSTTMAELAQYNLGSASGTTSDDAIEQQIKPTTAAKVFTDNDKAVKALKNGQIDGVVLDLPTAFYIASTLENGVVVGQFPPLGGEQEYFGLVLEKDSPMTNCVNEAIAAMKTDGTWQSIFDQWLSGPTGAPLFQ